jgi:hypothetical protein
MASLTDQTTAQGRAQCPAVGTASFNAKEGKFYCYFPAKRDASGNVTKEAENAEIRNPKFMVVGVNFFRVVGGKPDRKDRTKFIGVSSPIVVTDKGFRWGQLIPVWVGREEKTPAIYGTWSEIKDQVDAKGGKYAELVFVVCADWPDRLFILELSGYAIPQFKDAVKACTGSSFTSSLVKSPHILEMSGAESYDIDGRTFWKPVFSVSKFNEGSKGHSQMMPVLMSFSEQVDAYGDDIAIMQKSGDLLSPEEVAKNATPTATPTPTPQPPSNAEPVNANITANHGVTDDDLPF